MNIIHLENPAVTIKANFESSSDEIARLCQMKNLNMLTLVTIYIGCSLYYFKLLVIELKVMHIKITIKLSKTTLEWHIRYLIGG